MIFEEKHDERIEMVDELLAKIEVCKNEIISEEVGIVLDSGDGVARIGGLPGALMGEMLDFGHNVYGVIFNLEEEEIVAVILESHIKVKEGLAVRRTSRILEIPVGENLLGRVLNPLGVPIDGKGPVKTENYRSVETLPPSVIERSPVNIPLPTGYSIIDSTLPIGHGQRELIIGDRQTGKTTLAIDTIINQKGKDVICIYVAIGQKNSNIAKVVTTLEEKGALDYTIIVNSPASSPSALQYFAPYTGCSMAEEFMYKGKRTLIIYDDLTKHAHAYRNISLLLQRSPGREAYPGDIFYTHSRLLERAAQLHEKLGGGSMTALPIIETQAGDISAFIPTNVISITDGQIFLSIDLYNANIRPAVNPGISVSRVGGAAQIKAMKKVAGLLRVTLAQFREKEKFSLFSADLDEKTVQQLHRGKVLIEALKQPAHKPRYIINQIIVIFGALNGYFDELALDKLNDFFKIFTKEFRKQYAFIYNKLDSTKDLDDDLKEKLHVAVKKLVDSLGTREED